MLIPYTRLETLGDVERCTGGHEAKPGLEEMVVLGMSGVGGNIAVVALA